MSHTNPTSIDSDQCTLTHTFSQETLSTLCNATMSSSLSVCPPPPTLSTSSSISHTSQQPNSNPSIDVEQEQDSVPFAAAGLTRAVETKHGLSLTEILNISTTNPSHLFWVPASQHPELAPTEFEKYVAALRAHTKDKGKVKRRRSVLSVSFTADDDDNDNTTSKNDDDDYDDSYSRDHERQSALEDLEKEHLRSTSLSLDDNDDHHPISRNRSSDNTSSNQDHDKDVSKARKERLRRSRSLHLPDNKDLGRIPEFLVFDRNSTALDQSPVLVPKTDRPLSRRGARTRFQRTSSIAPSSTGSADSTCPTQHQWSHHRHSDSLSSSPTTSTTSSTKSTDTTATTATQEQSDPTYQLCRLSNDSPTSDDSQRALHTLLSTITKELQQDHLQQYQQQRDVMVESPKDGSNESHHQAFSFSTTSSSPTCLSQPLIPNTSTRERKSSWSWSSLWSDDKKAKAEQPPANLPLSSTNVLPSLTTSSSTPTSSSVSKQKFAFASLFSRKPSSSSTSTTEEKATHSTMSPPKHFALNKINHQHRLPIHIERGVYRLSHVKLANPRRPLHDQVIISNFMFWYLSIANQHRPVDNPAQHIPPRTPQHAVASSKQKKKRLTRKSERQQPQQHQSSMYIQRPCNPPSSQAPWQKSVDISAHQQEQQQSTGFVIPNDYLHPTHRKKPSKSPQARPSSTSSGSSSSSSSEEDDDNDTSLYSHTPPKHPSQHDISLQPGAPTLITTKNSILPLR